MKKRLLRLSGVCLTVVVLTGVLMAWYRDIPVNRAESTENISEVTTESFEESESSTEEITEDVAESKNIAETTENPETAKNPEETENLKTTENFGETEVSKTTEDYGETENSEETENSKEQEDSEVPEIPNVMPTEIPNDISVDTIVLDLPEVSGKYELLFVNDLHILTVDESVISEQVPVALNRYENMFRGPAGRYSPETWKLFYNAIDDWQADAVIFGGDMLDFISTSNKELLKQGLEQIQTPYMYLRADHDLGTWYSGGYNSADDALGMQLELGDYTDMFVKDFGEFYVLGWNNSTSQLSESGLMTAIEVWDDGKPIVLATHVPVASVLDTGLADAAAAVDPHGRVKIWGDGYLYQPNDYTSVFLNMLYDVQSPVKAIFSGHLHFKFTTSVTEQTVEYVFAPAFAGNIAHITIK